MQISDNTYIDYGEIFLLLTPSKDIKLYLSSGSSLKYLAIIKDAFGTLARTQLNNQSLPS
jgi:hypothetical protein